MTKRMLAVAMLLMMIAAGALAAVSVPEPDSDLFYVYDGAKVLSTETEAQIYYNNVNLYKACGAEIVFVVVDDTDGYALEDYSAAIFDKWELYDRDVLVVLAIDDEDYWMVQGSSIEREMTGSTMRALLEDYLEPDFAKQNYDSGVRKLFDALFAEVTDIYNADISLVNGYEQYKTANEAGTQYAEGTRDDYGYYEYSDEDEGLSFGTILLIIIIVLVVIRSMKSSGRKGGGHKTIIVNPAPRMPHIPNVFHAPRTGGFTRPSGSRRTTSSGTSFSRPSGGSRSGGFGGRAGGGRSGGGGSRGGGVGRGR